MLAHIPSLLLKKRTPSIRKSRFSAGAAAMALCLALLLIPGCVTSGKNTKKTLAVKETNALHMEIKHYFNGDYFVHIAKDGGKWHVVEVMKTKPQDFDSKDELVSFNRAMTVTGPAFHHKMPENIIGCTAFDGASSTYTICNSEFGDANVTNTALITVMTLGISAACGGGYAVSFDEGEYVEIVMESGAIERVRSLIADEQEKAIALAAENKKRLEESAREKAEQERLAAERRQIQQQDVKNQPADKLTDGERINMSVGNWTLGQFKECNPLNAGTARIYLEQLVVLENQKTDRRQESILGKPEVVEAQMKNGKGYFIYYTSEATWTTGWDFFDDMQKNSKTKDVSLVSYKKTGANGVIITRRCRMRISQHDGCTIIYDRGGYSSE